MNQKDIVLVVSVSIIKEDKVLIIKEKKPFANNKWNFPSGRIEHEEDILTAACREVREETGYDVKLIATTGIYNFISRSNNQVILFHFTGEVCGGFVKMDEPEIVESKWIRLSELMDLSDDELREADVTRQIVNNLKNQQVHSLTVINKQLTGIIE
ncbi:NUDIX hydrolase [Bacillus sp. JJ722]|uniref:NUDIX hydrolase n=1 Tax=Bacillus sp. JJ722 TaxID=3122973 RepID=UPI002FFF7822